MKTIQTRYLDKSKFPEGPWMQEPDKIQWQNAATKLPCLIVRNHAGALCGYVGVAKGHPYFGVNYDKCSVEVHGGLTFSDFCRENTDGHGICHIPDAGEPDHVWWLGFDCGHIGDCVPLMMAVAEAYPMPALRALHCELGESYKDITYVQRECATLAVQLYMMQKNPDATPRP